MDFQFDYFAEVFPKVLEHLDVTLALTGSSTVCALVIGLVIAVISYYKVPGFYQVAGVFVFLMRGTPAVVQLYFFYYGIATVSELVRGMNPTMAVAVVISLNIGAFMSESIRGALLSVDSGQKEAAYSLGMSNLQLVRRIIIPQAARVALPALFNDMINIVKLSSLAFMLGVIDIMGAAKIEGSYTFRYFEIYAAVMVVYLVIIGLLTLVQRYLDKRCSAAY
ncbi:amino acid ABC transporter permease [Megasphaera coli]|uniref:amino acid ABC transporter permease n=1 Tax=Colibacter massiliensis TaxID=1852379 RepID=UPI00094EA0AF|nr:amino acid ABC transporter permease [Colibacter massiliensis]